MIAQIKKIGILTVVGLGLSSAAYAVAPDFMEKLQSDSRPMEDKIRDGARRPAQVMALMGIEEGMTVVDIFAGGGWYTRVLSAAVGPSGKVISHQGPRALQRNNGQAAKDLAAGLGNVEASFENLGDLSSGTADAAITALSIHHRTGDSGIAFMKEIYNLLKSGGVAAVIDHEGDAGADNGPLHRISKDEVRGFIQAAGFDIVEDSDLLHTSADDHTLGIRDFSLGRNTDRFLFLVRKP